jgi:hypothetical protein
MKSRSIAAAVTGAAATALVAIPLASGGTSNSGKLLFASMSGKREVNAQGNRNAGDPDGAGSFTATIDGDQLCFGITVRNLDNPVAAHIHSGGPNVMGPVVIPLTQPSAGDPGASSGCVTVTAAQSRALLSRPARFYANVHTAAFPNGAVRGQLFAKSP